MTLIVGKVSKRKKVGKKSVSKGSGRKKMPKTSDMIGGTPNAKFLAENLYALSIASSLNEGTKKKYEKCASKKDCQGELICISEMCLPAPETNKKIKPDDILKFLFSK